MSATIRDAEEQPFFTPLPPLEDDVLSYFRLARALERDRARMLEALRAKEAKCKDLRLRLEKVSEDAEAHLQASFQREKELRAGIQIAETRGCVMEAKVSPLEGKIKALEESQVILETKLREEKLRTQTISQELKDTSQEEQLRQKLHQTSQRLAQFEAAWPHMKGIQKRLQETERALGRSKAVEAELRRQLAEWEQQAMGLENKLSLSILRADSVEERLQKEKREKALALSSLEMAEQALEQRQPFSDPKAISLQF
jgi:chromosome segregation ATPase